MYYHFIYLKYILFVFIFSQIFGIKWIIKHQKSINIYILGKREGTMAPITTRPQHKALPFGLISLLSLSPLGFRHQRRRSGGGAPLRADITRGAAIPGGGGRWPRRRLCSDLGRDLDGDSRLSGRRRWTERAPAPGPAPALARRGRWCTRPGRAAMWAERPSSLYLCPSMPVSLP